MSTRAMVIVGAGSSTRFGAEKLTVDIEGRPLVAVTVGRVVECVDKCVLVVRPEMMDEISQLELGVSIAVGGATRTLSEMAGLAAVGDTWDLTGIHDAARPLVTERLIEELFAAAENVGGAAPVLENDELILERKTHLPISRLSRVQTPQVFRSTELLAAYVLAARAGFEGHDTVEVVQRYSDLNIAAVPGEIDNLKVTYPSDVDKVIELSRT